MSLRIKQLRAMVTVLISIGAFSAGAAIDPALTDPPDDALVATSPTASLKVIKAPAKTIVPQALRTASNAVAGAYFDSSYRVFRPLRLRGDFYIRSSPSAQAQRIAVLRESALNSKVFLTGRMVNDGRGWVEVIEDGHEAWISADALIDGRPPGLRVIAANPKPQTLGEMFGGVSAPVVIATPPPAPAPAPARPPVVHAARPPAPSPVAVTPRPAAPRPVPPAVPAVVPVVVDPPVAPAPRPPVVIAPAPVPRPPVVVAPKPPPAPTGPLCVNSLKDFSRTARFQKAMPGDDPFTHWNGPFGASIDVNSDGSAILHHPIHGDIPLHLSLCLDASERPYISINGSPMYLQGADFTQVMVTDPTSGAKFQFNQVVN